MHSVQPVEPVAEANEPAAHVEHVVAAAKDANSPVAHKTQDEALAVE
jgi:hypothetical protein